HLDDQQPIDAHVPPDVGGDPVVESSDAADPSASASEVPSASGVPSSSTPSPPPSSSDPSKPVPSVVGMTEDQARRTLGDEGFVPEVAYTGEGTPCTVSEQDPGSTAPMPPGTTVRITVQRTAEVCGA
ncbi:MAG TPA: PASTA domain-containing protein, partial [Phytomonospora sp.]